MNNNSGINNSDINNSDINHSDIAIIGMSCQFPGAKNIDEFWQNLHDGVESISFFDDEELLASGIDSALIDDPNYVKAYGALSDIDLFDAAFFSYNPKEAQIMDPQHRLFLEHAWKAMENAGYDAETYEGAVGVYAGSQTSYYLFNNLYQKLEPQEQFRAFIANDRDFLSTRVSYKLNLTGPSVTVQTACSTSLVTVHMACQSLLNGECDMVLAGGSSVYVPQKTGYLYEQGMIYSPDGRCRAFDANAKGIIGGSGVGIVVLKRLTDAIASGDQIHAVIKGSAVNNDGSMKLSYTAPSIDLQTAVISEAQSISGVDPETITYIEAHGTGTELGDPIEIAALTQAFRVGTERKGFCAIGSVKTNVGHLGAAAGVAGLIKTVLALKHRMIPPSLHFEQPNPKIDFANSPFYVNTKLSAWDADRSKTPRRAGVSSLGFGGTNAHIVLEEAPTVERQNLTTDDSRSQQLLLLSARSDSALETATTNLVEHLQQNPHLNLADVAYTLAVGRRVFDYRRMVVCQNTADTVQVLESLDPKQVVSEHQEPCYRPVVFMFSGQGSQYVNMGLELYEQEPYFRKQIDTCSEILKPHIGLDLRHIIYPTPEGAQEASQRLKQTAITQPALFVLEYALAKLWMEWGVHPVAMVGHSIGEYVAATLASVFSLEDALLLVATRGQLMQQLPAGSMLAVPLPEAEVIPLLDDELSLAVVNGPSLCVVSGPTDAIEALENKLDAQEFDYYRRLHTSHAFHSQMMEPILTPFIERLKQVNLKSPQIPYISNVTGTWIEPQEATSPTYWANHLRQTVRFNQGLEELLKEPTQILLEVGPGKTLSKLAQKHPDKNSEQIVLNSLRHPKENLSDLAFLFNKLGKLWLCGVQINWSGFYNNEKRHRLPLPTYPFERQSYWIEAPRKSIKGTQWESEFTSQQLWKSLVEAGQIQAQVGDCVDEQTYLDNQLWMNRLCTEYIIQTLRNLGVFQHPSDKYSLEQLFEECQVLPQYQQLFRQWLQILVDYGHLQQDEGIFSQTISSSTYSLNTLLEEVRKRWVNTPQVVNLTQQCGENLASILVGEKQPLEIFNSVIFQQGKSSNVEVPLFPYYNSIIQKVLEQILKKLKPHVNLRILEIGGGQGMSTSQLLPILTFPQTSYTFTDVGSWFLTQAKQKFSDYPSIEYGLLDIEKSPQAQGYASHSFDIILAANVLHVTQNIGETLEHVRSLLAPSGLLILWEITQPQLHFNITSGLLMNPIEDEENARNMADPFLSKQHWEQTLKTHGFVEVAAFPETNAFGQHIIVAQATTSNSAPAAFTLSPQQLKQGEEDSQVGLTKKPDITDWFYVPSWNRSMLPSSPQGKITKTGQTCWLVFVDECGLGTQIIEKLKLEDENVIIVRADNQANIKEESTNNKPLQQEYTIDPRQENSYDDLLKQLRDRELIPQQIIHCWSLTSDSYSRSGFAEFEQTQEKGFYSLLLLAQALGRQSFTGDLQITVVSNNLQAVTGEESLYPEKATLLGLVRVIPQEYSNIRCRSIDVVLSSPDSKQNEKLVSSLFTELTTPSNHEAIAYRGIHRWVQTLEAVQLNQTTTESLPLRQQGVYLVTGGLGAIGLAIAEYLAQTVQAKLVLIGRSAFPDREGWSEWLDNHDEDDDISHKIRALQKIQELGAEVLVASADVANSQQMQEAIANAQRRFGQINGVVHSAGILGDSAIQRKTLEQVKSVLAPKVKGILILDTILKNVELDFFVLCSSIGSFIPLFGQVAYSAANNFLDAFANYKTSTNQNLTISINWDGWQAGGMGVKGTKRLVKTLHQNQNNSYSEAIVYPLFEQSILNDHNQTQEIYISKLSVSKHWVLDEHRVMGKAALPGTGYLDIIRAACEKYANGRTIEIEEITFLKLLEIEEEEEKEVQTILTRQGNNFEFLIQSQSYNQKQNQNQNQSNSNLEYWQENARGQVIFLEDGISQKHNIQEIESNCYQNEIIVNEQGYTFQTGFAQQGPRWKNCQWIKFGTNEGLALLELPEEFTEDLNFYQLHPALLDVATSFLTIDSQYEGSYLPFSYKRLKIKAALPAKVYSHIRSINSNHSQTGLLKLNITIMDLEGSELVTIEEYTLRKFTQEQANNNTVKDSQHIDREVESNPDRRNPEHENSYLSISSVGMLNSLKFLPTQRQKPGAGEVEIEVGATGLNFLEVLLATGLIQLPGDLIFGRECAGKIVALGEGVEEFKIGDSVIAFGSSCFSRFTITPAKLVAPKPQHLSVEEAATIPTAFTTAYLALVKYAQLRRGEKVLIHAASGGVGMAAIQIAQWIGAEIFATAGTPKKREFLHSLGIEHVMDSRSLVFADEIMKRTDGKGVDVVLNSLGGEFISKSLSVLARYGRFLEIGLRDIIAGSKLNLKPFENNLSFFSIHLDLERSNFNSLWREVVQHFEDGNFRPLTHQVFPMTKVADAFDYMAQAKHIGKIVISAGQEGQNLMIEEPITSTPSNIHADSLKKVTTTYEEYQKDFVKGWLSPTEGIEVFKRILGSKLPQVLVSASDLQLRSEQKNKTFQVLKAAESLDNSEFFQVQQPKSEKFANNNSLNISEGGLESTLMQIWQETLGVEKIGIHENFFELGGDSLLAVQVISKVRKIQQVDLPVSLLFEKPTLAGMMEYLENNDRVKSSVSS